VGSSDEQYAACVKAAASGDCAAIEQETDACLKRVGADVDGNQYDVCGTNSDTWESVVKKLSAFFCGP